MSENAPSRATNSRSVVFSPVTLGPLRLRNRVIKAATFEGATPHGVVTDQLIDFHTAVARGGVAMTTVAYLSVAPEGRTHAEQIVLGPATVAGLRRLTDAVHAEGAAIAAQIGHAGPVANAKSNGAPALSPSVFFNPLGMARTKPVSVDDMDRLTGDFASAARRAVEAGFDAIELHLGHNYLLSSFLSRPLNRRSDGFGGSLENRARFPRRIVEAVRAEVGDRVALTAKFNMVDGFPGGLWLDESLRVARWLQGDGHLDALTLTGGSSLMNPMYLFKGDAPRYEFAKTLPRLLRFGFRFAGTRFMPEYPYSEAYFLPFARQFRDALSMPLILLGGISELATAELGIEEGFAAVAMGRALLREPDLLRTWHAGDRSTSLCIHCNKCMPTIYSGTRCVLVDPSNG